MKVYPWQTNLKIQRQVKLYLDWFNHNTQRQINNPGKEETGLATIDKSQPVTDGKPVQY